ncbi:MAG TPA: glutamine-hydrolyzing GMP synthase [Flavobacteriales bacterium]|jgi:GMP synthase (glutamine-hydrolysing)|nr:glutamine-hydrolyzing GMP synthase [Flavobacteriales bacterium]HHZ97730.1 glutamine-hydrolyzing GMP synthase [Flavobacteriales bacterium]HIB77934.1 glutamine-hydrolyzing GMP synthase [Flavobacteriales bacterium]HIN41567.1 glutamine-hydrolyzing GMP synthase [Flavobacteriales bacterium]HIO15628.1 glutamine-hydrolyzing GMP synthase [Flavobacteriales bacterium]
MSELRPSAENILILDFGSQYTQLIARRVREINVYSEIIPWNKFTGIPEGCKGVILSGSPYSVRDVDAPQPDVEAIIGKVPLLGVCYGAQYLALKNGGSVEASDTREYGRANLSEVNTEDELLNGMTLGSQVWMSHGDTILGLGDGYETLCSTSDVKFAGFRDVNEKVWGIQFHPEVFHSTEGPVLIKNFIIDICGCTGEWTPDNFADATISELKDQIGSDEHVILGLSGGVDSTVAAELLHRAIGDKLHCIFVDNGLLRKGEFDQVLDDYEHMGLNVRGVRAGDQFMEALKGLSDPELKRKAIGRVFVEVFDEASKAVEGAKWLGQGTIYPDVIESVSATGGPSATIKSHHNVGGLPDYMTLKVVEPLRSIFKDEVRRVGKALNIKPRILARHPFPGPGLGIRILGDVTPEKVRVLQEVDFIFINGLREAGLYDSVWQAGAMLLPVQSVGVMGDERTYENTVALRAVTSTDGMTADWSHLPYDFLAKVSNDIINKVRGVNRVVYDISSKPPATIEWE